MCAESYFESCERMNHEGKVETDPANYDGSRMLVATSTAMIVLFLVPMSMWPLAFMAWSILTFSLSFGVPLWQVLIPRAFCCLVFLSWIVGLMW